MGGGGGEVVSDKGLELHMKIITMINQSQV